MWPNLAFGHVCKGSGLFSAGWRRQKQFLSVLQALAALPSYAGRRPAACALSYFWRHPPPKILLVPAKPGHIKPVKALILGQNHPILLQFKLTARLLFQKFHHLLLIF
jgi:hypothetical protein